MQLNSFPYKLKCFCHHLILQPKNIKLRKLKNSYIPQFFKHNHCYHTRSTIFALSTSPGISAIAVIRISGPSSAEVFDKMFKLKKTPAARKAILCKLKDPNTDELLDKALALWFPSPNSFTGEDLCELHVHGGTAVIKSVLNALLKLPHFRFAEPGEFTKRAFMAGKLDLTEVEGLADLLNAETEGQQKQALRQMDGALYKLYSDWSGRLKQCLANLEAYIDFSEDQHLDSSIFNTVQEEIAALKREISFHLLDKRKGEKLRSGVNAVLVGKPNVGKSSLMNSLCNRDIAIVSSHAGTTRDIIESSLNLGGYLVNICDTAGIRETCNSIEEEGVKRAKKKSSQADLLLFIMEADKAIKLLEVYSGATKNIKEYLLNIELGENFIESTVEFIPNTMETKKKDYSNVIILLNKCDLLDQDNLQKIKELENSVSDICMISCIDGEGMEKFVHLFSEKINELCCGHCGEEPAITQERHRHHVQNCSNLLLEYEENLKVDIAIAADCVRSAMNELGKITGKVMIDDILDVVFRNFCIGK